MNELTMYINWPSRQFTSEEGGNPNPLTFVLGDQLRIETILQNRDTSGTIQSFNDLPIRTIRASLGKTMNPPTLGKFVLAKDLVDIPELDFAVTAADLQTALGAAEVSKVTDCCWLVRMPGTEEITFSETEGSNKLFPSSFCRVRKFEVGAYTWFEVRLIQTPWAFADSFERVLPEGPTVSRIRAGQPTGPGETVTNEIQAIKVPADFVGTYYVEFDFRTSAILGVQDGPDIIASTLNAMYDDGEVRFIVTNPENEKAYVEFVGELGETAHDLMVIRVNTFEQGRPNLILNLETSQFNTALRAADKIENVPFELEFEVMENEEDIEDPEISVRPVTIQMLVTCVREQIFSELALVPSIDFIRPPQPKSYQPMTVDQIITGQQHHVTVRGDGVARSFVIDHGLDTDDILVPSVLKNIAPCMLLIHGLDFTFQVVNEASVIVSLLDAAPTPAADGLKIIVTSAGPASAFSAHTHTIADIVGLQDLLDEYAERITTIEDKLPHTTPTASSTTTKVPIEITIPDKVEMLPGRYEEGFNFSAGIPLSRPPALPCAVHTASGDVLALTDPLPSTPTADRVYRNTTGASILIPGGRGLKSATILHTGDDLRFLRRASFDGRLWYPVQQLDNASTSHYPTQMERILTVIPINDKMLRTGKKLEVLFSLTTQMLKANVNAQYNVMVELGELPADTTPSPIGLNLRDVVWDTAVPIMSHRITMTELGVKSGFGFSIIRSVTNTFSTDRLLYGLWEASEKIPTSANFAIRIKLGLFDVENDPVHGGTVDDPKGTVFYKLTDAKAQITSN
jgi:hypothetical protein